MPGISPGTATSIIRRIIALEKRLDETLQPANLFLVDPVTKIVSTVVKGGVELVEGVTNVISPGSAVAWLSSQADSNATFLQAFWNGVAHQLYMQVSTSGTFNGVPQAGLLLTAQDAGASGTSKVQATAVDATNGILLTPPSLTTRNILNSDGTSDFLFTKGASKFFSATTAVALGNNNVAFTVGGFDPLGAFVGGNYVAPVAGVYLFIVLVNLTVAQAYTSSWNVNGVVQSNGILAQPQTAIAAVNIFNVAAGVPVAFQFNAPAANGNISSSSYMAGVRIA